MKVESDLANVETYSKSVKSEYESNLKMFVDIPSVSADPEHKADIRKMADAAVSLLKSMGAEAHTIETKGNPIVVGEFKAAGDCPTVTIYNHLDVQPADPEDWKDPPFNMSIHDGVYKGRGTTDDKGPALAALYGAKYAHDHKVPLNIRFLWRQKKKSAVPILKISCTPTKTKSPPTRLLFQILFGYRANVLPYLMDCAVCKA